MAKLRTDLTRLKIYKLLVDGRGPNSGYHAAEIARQIKMKGATVSYHIEALVSEGYVTVIQGTRRPTFYVRGRKSNLLDKAMLESGVRIDGGTVNTPTNSNTLLTSPNTPRSRPEERDVLTARAHINGRVVFDVLKQGEHEYIEVPNGNGKTRFNLFSGEPYFCNHGVKKWKTRVPYDGFQVSIEYQESAKTKTLYVWPPEIELVPEQFDDAEALIITRAQQAVNLLQKYGGWRFGLVQFCGDIEYASSDARILSQIPDDIRRRTPGSECWIDGSKGEPEFETTGAENAQLVFNFPKTVRELRTNQIATINEVYTLHMTVKELASVVRSLLELKTNETKEEVEQIIKSMTKPAATAANGVTESGGMYR